MLNAHFHCVRAANPKPDEPPAPITPPPFVFQIFYPETTDIYDRKNMPRCIYCIHALRYPSPAKLTLVCVCVCVLRSALFQVILNSYVCV